MCPHQWDVHISTVRFNASTLWKTDLALVLDLQTIEELFPYCSSVKHTKHRNKLTQRFGKLSVSLDALPDNHRLKSYCSPHVWSRKLLSRLRALLKCPEVDVHLLYSHFHHWDLNHHTITHFCWKKAKYRSK